MNLQTFTAPSMNECLREVKQAMGTQAVILHTRTYTKRSWLGLRRKLFVEITAGKGISGAERARSHSSASSGKSMLLGAASQQLVAANRPPSSAINFAPVVPAGAYRAHVNAVATNGPSALALPPGQELLCSPVATQIIGTEVARDVQELKKLVAGLVDTIHKKDAPSVPEELFDHYLCLIQNEVANELAGEILQSMRKQLRPDHLGNDSFIREKIAEHIEKLIPSSGPIVRTKTVGPHVVALIGPTGVGKTTTIAKLAAKLKLVEKKRVGLITIDTYRIAAIDQLRRYADILGSSLCVINSAADLRQAIHSMRECEYILIDTAGRSPRDMMKINELKSFLDAAEPDEVHLVLSSTASQECIELAIERFSDVKFEKVIFTKLDEAAHVGVVLNVIRKLNKSLSYITTGQDVPDDIEVGHGKRLAKLILGEMI